MTDGAPLRGAALAGGSADLTPSGPPPSLTGRAIAHAAVVLLLTRITTLLLTWLLEVVLVRMLTPDEWNTMSRFLTVVTAFTIAQFGFPESVLYFAAKTRSLGAGLRLAARTSGVLAVSGLLLALPFFAFPGLAERTLGMGGERLLVPLAALVTADLAFAPLPSFLLAQKRPKLASALSIGTRIPIAASVVFAIAAGLGVPEALLCMAIGALLSLAAGWAVVLRVSGKARADGAAVGVTLGEQVRFSVPVGLTKLVQIANVKLDKYIVMTVFAESVFGTYYLGATEFPVPSMICTAVMTIMMADLVRAALEPDRTELLRLWHRSIEKIALIVLPIFTFLFAFAGPLFAVLYGEVHEGASQQFRIFSILLLARVTNYTQVSLALGQPRVPLIAAGIALGFNAVLSIVFVQVLGLIGPAVANVTAIALSTIYTMHGIRSSLGVPWRELFPFGRYARTLGVALVAALPGLAVLWFLDLTALPTVLLGVTLHVATYVGLARAASLMTADDIGFLRSLLRLEFLGSR
jgi:O-antigen/teichoic acid export membrane protein